MNKLFTKIAALALGATMAVGVGVAVASSNQEAKAAFATIDSGYTAATMTAGTNGSSAVVVIGGQNNTAIKVGTSSKGGDMSITVPSGATDLRIYAAAWKGVTGLSLNITKTSGAASATISPSSVALTADDGMTSSSPFTLSGTESNFKFDFTLANITQNTVYKFASSKGSRFVVWSAQTKAKSLSSIAVATAPTKTTYIAGEHFDPTGLVITRTYSDATHDTYTYAGHTTEFTFSPTTSTALATSNTSVTITYGGKSCSQAITVTAPKTPASVASAGQKTTFDSGDTFIYDGTLTVTYENAGGSATVSPTSFKIGEDDIDPTTSGTAITPNVTTLNNTDHNGKTVYILYTENNTTVYTSYVITVNKISKVTISYSDVLGKGASGGGTALNHTKNGINLAISSGFGNTNYFHVYKNATMTISFATGISRIELTDYHSIDSSDDKTLSGFASISGYSDGVWTGDSTSVTFTASNAQVHLREIEITLKSTEPSVEVDPASIDLKTNNTTGVTVTATVQNVETPTYSWVKSNNNIVIEETENDNVIIVKPNVQTEASSKITLTVGGATPDLDPVEINVSITEPGPGETPETAYTVAQATAAITAAETDIENVYITGKITQIDEVSLSYKNATYWINDTDSTTGQFKIYHGKYVNNTDFTAEDQINIGDTVIVFGTISKQHGSLNQGNYIYSLTPLPKVNSITLTPNVVTVEPSASGDIEDLFSSIVIDQDEGSTKTVSDIVWTSSDESVFYIVDGDYLAGDTHKSTATITATLSGKTATATVTVIDPSHPFITYDVPVSYTKVTDDSTLAAGDVIIIASETQDVVMGSLSGNYATEVSATFDGGEASVEEPLELTLGGSAGAWTLRKSNTEYLWSSTAKTIGFKNDSTCTWTIAISSGDATITYGSNGRILHNVTSSRFTTYTSNTSASMLLPQIYKKTGGGTATLDLDDTILTLVRGKMSEYEDEHGETQYGLSICNYYGGSDLSGWSTTVANGFTESVISTYKLAYARSNRTGNDVEKFLSAYDYVVENYGASYDFLGRIASGKVTPAGERANVLPTVESSNSVAVIVIISIASLTAIGGYFFLRKRREQN